MDEIRWEDPPVGGRDRFPWVATFVDELKQHPGKWAKVVAPDGRELFGSSSYKRFQTLGCETRLSTIGAPVGRFYVWARWPEI